MWAAQIAYLCMRADTRDDSETRVKNFLCAFAPTLGKSTKSPPSALPNSLLISILAPLSTNRFGPGRAIVGTAFGETLLQMSSGDGSLHCLKICLFAAWTSPHEM